MIIFKSKSEDGSNSIELNYCENGIYVEVRINDEMLNYIIPHSEVYSLMEYLKTEG